MIQDNTDITHFHLNECHSTQAILKEKLSHKKNLLVSTDFQTNGVGRQGKSWLSSDQALAMSFTLKPNETLSLTSLEVGVLVCKYFRDYPISLKWPNDLMIHKHKIGGILCQNIQNTILVGLGLNLYHNSMKKLYIENSFFKASSLSKERLDISLKELSLDIYQFILNHRLTSSEVISDWQKKCEHLFLNVSLYDEQKETHGIFTGIASNGEAIINEKRYVSGSLSY